MNENFIKEVANALVAKAEKSVLVSIINNILDNEDGYNNPIASYVVRKCLGKPQLTIVDVDLEKVKKYAEEHYTNNFYTLVEGSVELVGVNPVRRTVQVRYQYTENEAKEKKVRTSSSDIDTEYADVLKDE